MTGVPLLPAAVVEREEGRRAAREELSERIYGQAEPSLLELIRQRLQEWFDELLDVVGSAVPGGWWTLAPLLVVLALVLVALVVYLRPARRARRRGAAVDTGSPMTAADHRAAAEGHAEQGDYAAAIRERLRAVSRELEDSAVITPRPGRTATELAAETAEVLPQLREQLYAGADTFNDSAYGQRIATAEDYRVLADLDERVGRARPADAAAASAVPSGGAL
ncbi:DUF4129 domain-containing protein [Streptomonospora litoralis]|uniref:DUF4129 domain-containing protein n=1 Tax=Streptomonospora litoralis TaxID=2498135 RepID=UPI001F61EC3E|nr:DUF4129 domain-containing protein [Streptomonospora litoralis]